MAAGLSLEGNKIEALRIGLSKSIEKQIGRALPVLPVQIDAVIKIDELSLELVNDLSRLAPFGMGNPQIILASTDLQLSSQRTIGRTNEHLLASVTDPAGALVDVIWWQGSHYPPPGERFDLAYTVHASDYRGKPGVQLTWVASRELVPEAAPSIEGATIEWIDRRRSPFPELELKTLLKEDPDAQVWAEGGLSPSSQNVRRRTLSLC